MVGKGFMIKDILNGGASDAEQSAGLVQKAIEMSLFQPTSPPVCASVQSNQNALISYASATFELFRLLLENAGGSNVNNNNNNNNVNNNNNNSELFGYQSSPMPIVDVSGDFGKYNHLNSQADDGSAWKYQRKRVPARSGHGASFEGKSSKMRSGQAGSSRNESKPEKIRMRDRIERQSEPLSSPGSEVSSRSSKKDPLPAWIFCTRYSDRPTSGYRRKRSHRKDRDEKKPRTVFTHSQLEKLCTEFQTNKYLTDQRRRVLADELQLHEGQIKIWFQNMRAKKKRLSGAKSELAERLAEQGLYNHKRA